MLVVVVNEMFLLRLTVQFGQFIPSACNELYKHMITVHTFCHFVLLFHLWEYTV